MDPARTLVIRRNLGPLTSSLAQQSKMGWKRLEPYQCRNMRRNEFSWKNYITTIRVANTYIYIYIVDNEIWRDLTLGEEQKVHQKILFPSTTLCISLNITLYEIQYKDAEFCDRIVLQRGYMLCNDNTYCGGYSLMELTKLHIYCKYFYSAYTHNLIDILFCQKQSDLALAFRTQTGKLMFDLSGVSGLGPVSI